MAKDKKYDVNFRIWFYSGEEIFLGKGRVELLERIKETGSITNAAKGMKMSYRQAWQMVNEMNERANELLVEKSLGGKSGGGSTITNAGERAIEQFKVFEQKVRDFIANESISLNL